MEDFLNRWAETRLQKEPDWDADKELEQGLASFQTLLEFHTDIAFDFFEAWSLRNIFAVHPDLPLVAPHHAGLDLINFRREAELLAEVDELWRKIKNQKHLKRLLTRAARASQRHAKQAQTRLDRLSFIQPEQLRELHVLAKDVDTLYMNVSGLPPLDPIDMDVHLPEPGKREWEVGKAGYLSWASAQLIENAKGAAAGGSVLGGASAEEVSAVISKEDVAAAVHALGKES